MTTFSATTVANQLQHEIDRCERLLVPAITSPYFEFVRMKIAAARRAIDDDDITQMTLSLARLRNVM